MKKNPAWSIEEDFTLLSNLQNCNKNVTAYEYTSEATGRSIGACEVRKRVLQRQGTTLITLNNTMFEMQKELTVNVEDEAKETQSIEPYNIVKEVEKLVSTAESQTKAISELTKQNVYLVSEIDRLTESVNLHSKNESLLVSEKEAMSIQLVEFEAENRRLIEERDNFHQENNLFMNIMNKARKMFTGTDKEEKPSFKMERNGNLERVK